MPQSKNTDKKKHNKQRKKKQKVGEHGCWPSHGLPCQLYVWHDESCKQIPFWSVVLTAMLLWDYMQICIMSLEVCFAREILNSAMTKNLDLTKRDKCTSFL